MSENTFKCVKCGGKMIRGFNVDSVGSNRPGWYYPSFWIEGEPINEKNIFGGDMSNLDLDGQKKFIIRSLRCEGCGYLENYAV